MKTKLFGYSLLYHPLHSLKLPNVCTGQT